MKKINFLPKNRSNGIIVIYVITLIILIGIFLSVQMNKDKDENNEEIQSSSQNIIESSTSTINLSELAEPTKALSTEELISYKYENDAIEIGGTKYKLGDKALLIEEGNSINIDHAKSLLQKNKTVTELTYIQKNREITYLVFGELPIIDEQSTSK